MSSIATWSTWLWRDWAWRASVSRSRSRTRCSVTGYSAPPCVRSHSSCRWPASPSTSSPTSQLALTGGLKTNPLLCIHSPSVFSPPHSHSFSRCPVITSVPIFCLILVRRNYDVEAQGLMHKLDFTSRGRIASAVEIWSIEEAGTNLKGFKGCENLFLSVRSDFCLPMLTPEFDLTQWENYIGQKTHKKQCRSHLWCLWWIWGPPFCQPKIETCYTLEPVVIRCSKPQWNSKREKRPLLQATYGRQWMQPCDWSIWILPALWLAELPGSHVIVLASPAPFYVNEVMWLMINGHFMQMSCQKYWVMPIYGRTISWRGRRLEIFMNELFSLNGLAAACWTLIFNMNGLCAGQIWKCWKLIFMNVVKYGFFLCEMLLACCAH